MAKPGVKFAAQMATKIEAEVFERFIANAEACKSTKDIVLRELVYAFNRFCEAQGGRFPVLQRLEIDAPGYTVEEGKVVDATPGAIWPSGTANLETVDEIAAKNLHRRKLQKLRRDVGAKEPATAETRRHP